MEQHNKEKDAAYNAIENTMDAFAYLMNYCPISKTAQKNFLMRTSNFKELSQKFNFTADEFIEYREAQDDYLEFLAQTLSEGKYLPKNIIEEYKPYYKGTAKLWKHGFKGFLNEFIRFVNI